MNSFRIQRSDLLLAGCLTLLGGCTIRDAADGESLTDVNVRQIMIDGSSTVEPITSRVAERFEEEYTDVQVPVKVTGTGTGLRELAAGRVDIANASRPMTHVERANCTDNGIEVLELKIAIDGLTVAVNPRNEWIDRITVAQLKRLWEPGSQVRTWRDLDPSFPNSRITLYGAGEESGTFDYFTEAINGRSRVITDNYSPSADDNVIATGIAGDRNALGFFGFAYYLKNKNKLKALAISPTEDLADAVAPTMDSIEAGRYTPLSRPLFICVRQSSLRRAEVEDFVRFYLTEGQSIVSDAGYVPLNAVELSLSKQAFEDAVEKALADAGN